MSSRAVGPPGKGKTGHVGSQMYRLGLLMAAAARFGCWVLCTVPSADGFCLISEPIPLSF